MDMDLGMKQVHPLCAVHPTYHFYELIQLDQDQTEEIPEAVADAALAQPVTLNNCLQLSLKFPAGRDVSFINKLKMRVVYNM